MSKYLGLGQTVTRVPVFGSPLLAARAASFSRTSPSAKLIACALPSRQTVTSSRRARALVTDTPTPCSPPENE